MNFPVFDLHCDTAFAMLLPNFDSVCSLRKNELHIDLERASALNGYAQCFACFTSDGQTLPLQVSPETVFLREISAITEGIQHNTDTIVQAFSAEEIKKNRECGKMSAILSIEGPAGFGYDSDKLPELYHMGFRITTLGWNENNPLTGSHFTGGGLTSKGVAYVKQAQRLGMIIDVSHISDEAFWDIMSITGAPIIASHSNSRAVWDVSRNLTDEMFLAICQTGGVVGINLYAGFLGDQPDLDTVCDHICHFLSLDPNGDHIALGGDLDGCDTLPNGFCGVQDYPKLAEKLLSRGADTATVEKIFWNNAMEVFRRCCI